MVGKKLRKLGLEGLLLLENSGLVGQNRTHVNVKASISCVRRTRCSWVSSRNASKRSVRASTESSKSGVGLNGAASEVCCGGGGGG